MVRLENALQLNWQRKMLPLYCGMSTRVSLEFWVWCDEVCYGVIWYGIVWYGHLLVWHGIMVYNIWYGGVLVAQWSEHLPFTSEVAGSILSENVLSMLLEPSAPLM